MVKKAKESLRISWSGMLTFNRCARRYQLEYEEGLYRPDIDESRGMKLGSHVHAGMERAMRHFFDTGGKCTMNSLVTEAHLGIRAYRQRDFDPSRQRYNWELRVFEPDHEYIQTMDEIFEEALAIVGYQLPRFEWERYLVPTANDLFGEKQAKYIVSLSPSLRAVDDPLIEWKFELPVNENVTLAGVIDCVLWDVKQHEYVLVDWKTRSQMQDDDLVKIDGQLPLYAATINALLDDTVVLRCIQYQMSSSIPSPVKLTTKGAISKARPGSTWDVWAASVYAMGENPEAYRAEMYEKMNDPSFYTNPVEVMINQSVDQFTWENVNEVITMMSAAKDYNVWPAVLSSDDCRFCPFKKICVVYQGGGDPNVIIQYDFAHKNGYVDKDVTDEL